MEIFERLDTIRGTVIGCNEHGCRVREDESGKVVFYYGNGFKGDRVQLSIKRIDLERERVTCVLDSVLEYADYVAWKTVYTPRLIVYVTINSTKEKQGEK